MATEYTTNEYQCEKEGGDRGRGWREMEAEMERDREAGDEEMREGDGEHDGAREMGGKGPQGPDGELGAPHPAPLDSEGGEGPETRGLLLTPP